MMRWPWRKQFRPDEADEAVERYIKTALRTWLEVAEGTPPLVEPLPGGADYVRRRVDYGRSRDLIVSFYPVDPRRELAAERLTLARSLAKREITVPEVVFEDRTPETRRAFGFEVVGERRFEPLSHEHPWAAEDTLVLAGVLRRIHSLTSKTGGKPWRPANPDGNFLGVVEKRWTSALTIAQAALDRRLKPAAAGSFLEKALGRLEGVSEYELTHGDPSPWSLVRLRKGHLAVVAFGDFHYGYRERDLVLAEQAFFSRPGASYSFVETYFRGLSQAVRRRYDALRPFFLALYHLERAAQAARLLPRPAEKDAARSKKNGEKGQSRDPSSAPEEEALRCWKAFLDASRLAEQ